MVQPSHRSRGSRAPCAPLPRAGHRQGHHGDLRCASHCGALTQHFAPKYELPFVPSRADDEDDPSRPAGA